MWDVAEPRNKKFKMFFQGPPGCFKTRVALRLANNGDRKSPSVGVIDTEFGTDHYADDFAFRRLQSNEPDVIYQEAKKLVKNPGNIRTLIIDSFSVYYDALMTFWADRFKLRELNSAGNKTEYYTIQPRDYVHINRSASKLVRLLLKCDLNIICICQIKEQWGDNMKVIGTVFDGWKRLPYYFDTIIGIEPNKQKPDTWDAKILGKDRSYSFKVGESIPWKNDEAIVKHMVKKMGTDLSGGDLAESYDPDAKKAVNTEVPETASKDKPADQESSEQVEQATDKKVSQATESTENVESEKIAANEISNETETEVADEPVEDNSGPVTKVKLIEVARHKKESRVNDPEVWAKMVAKYDIKSERKSAKNISMAQADELIKDLIRGEIPT